jgi:serine/threonine protein kinase
MNCQQCNTPTPEDSPYCPECGAKVMKTQNDPLIGRTFLNQYIISKKLGQGGFGSVYEANQPSVGRKAVLKILHQHLSNSPEIAVRFRREGLAASKLSHPAIVRVYNFGETDDGLIWIAMEHVDGETLSARLRRAGPLTTKGLCETLQPICEALDEAHKKGIIHRDLKPDNIMLCKNQGATVKLLDFGVAGLVDDIQVTSTGMMSGSPPYMPPEQWKGLKYTDARSDVYALGVVAYQCLSGRLPFDADTSPAWMQKHCNEPPIELTDVSKATTSVIFKAMAKKPEERFASTIEFIKALEDAERGVSQKLPESLQPTKETGKTPKSFYLITALGIAAAFAVGLFLQRPPAPQATPATPIATSQALTPVTAPQTKTASAPSTAPTSIAAVPQKDTPNIKKDKIKPAKSEEQRNQKIADTIAAFIETEMDFNSCNQLPEPLLFGVSLLVDTNGQVRQVKGFAPFEKAKPSFECARQKLLNQSFRQKPSQEIFFTVNVRMFANYND